MRRTYALAAAFVLVFLAFRIGYIKHSDPASFMQPDSYGYTAMAESAFTPGGMTIGQIHSLRMPGYPLFLAAVFRVFGKSVAAVQGAQILLSLLACWFLFRISAQYLDDDRAWLVLFLLAVSYGAFSQDAMVLCESLYVLLVLAALYFLLRGKMPASGLFFAAAYFVRQEILVFILLAAGAALLKDRAPRRALLFLLPLALFLSLWGARNYRVTGRFFVGTTASYRHLYYSNEYVFKRLGWKPSGGIEVMPEGLDEFQEDEVRKGWCAAMFSQQPLPALLAAPVIKLAYFIYPFLPAFDLTFTWTLPFWLYGMFLMRKEWKANWQLYGMFSVLAALVAVFHAIPRTRGIFYPFILIFAARALSGLWKSGGRQKAWLALWTAANVGVYLLQAPARALLKSFL